MILPPNGNFKLSDGICALSKGGVFSQDATDKPSFYQAVHLAFAVSKRISSLLDEKRQLIRKMAEIQLVCRTKYVLTEQFHLTEAEAHQRIEKQAMDLRMSKEEIAKEILEGYEG